MLRIDLRLPFVERRRSKNIRGGVFERIVEPKSSDAPTMKRYRHMTPAQIRLSGERERVIDRLSLKSPQLHFWFLRQAYFEFPNEN